MASRALLCAVVVALAAAVVAAPAGAVTDIHLLLQTGSNDVAGIGPSNSGSSFVFTADCSVKRVIPGVGDGSPTVVAGKGCGLAHVVTTTATAATDVPLAGGYLAGTAGDDGFLVGDGSKGIVDRFTSADSKIQTFAGTGSCGPVPVDDSLAKNANLCGVQALAADPADSGRFAIADQGDIQVLGTNRVYLVSGTTRDNSTIKTVAGSCQPAPAVAALQLCFVGIHDIALAGSNTLLISQNGVLDAVNLTTGAVVSLLPDYDPQLGQVIGGYVGDAFFVSGCAVKRISALDGTGTITTVAGNGNCVNGDNPRANDVPATQTSMTPAALATNSGGVLVSESDDLRLIDRTSITSHPPRYTNQRDNSVAFATLSGGHTQCSFQGTLTGAFGFPDCNNPYTELSQGDDDYEFTVQENEGTMDPTPASWSWTVDTMAPSTPALSDPADNAHVDSATPTFKWIASTDPMPGGFIQIPGSGVDHYELLIDGSKDGDVACCQSAPAHPLSEGPHHWRVRAVDRAGNQSGLSGERTVEYGSPPVAVLHAAPNPALAGATVTLDGTESSDAEGPIADYAWDTDGDGSFERDTGGAATTTVSFAQPGTYTIGLRVTDAVGKTSQATANLQVNPGVAPGSLFGITIDNGAQYTRDPNVVIGIKAAPSVNSVILSNDGGFLVPSTFPIAKEIKWRLDSSGPERLPKIVYARFRAGTIVLDTTFSDDIILDETPPVVEQASFAGAPGAASAARLRAYVVKVKATDSNSGVAKLQLAAVKRKPGKLIRYKRTVRVKLAAKPKFIRARDRAGNFSPWKKIR